MCEFDSQCNDHNLANSAVYSCHYMFDYNTIPSIRLHIPYDTIHLFHYKNLINTTGYTMCYSLCPKIHFDTANTSHPVGHMFLRHIPHYSFCHTLNPNTQQCTANTSHLLGNMCP